MIKLIHGDIHKLEGKITVYGEVYENIWQSKAEYVAVYATKDKQDFDSWDFSTEDTKKKVFKSELDIKNSLLHAPMDFYTASVAINDGEDLLTKNGDIGYAGKHYIEDKSAEEMTELLIGEFGQDIGAYFYKYLEQTYIDKEKAYVPIPKHDNKPSKYSRESLRNIIIDHYINPLILAVDYEYNESRDAIIENFQSFWEGKEYKSDVQSIIELIREPYINNEKLIRLYVDKILAIYNEDYENAQFIDKIISRLPKFT